MPAIPAQYNRTTSRYTASMDDGQSIDAPDRDAMRRAFDLLVECCRQSFSAADPARLGWAMADVDWSLFLALARRHRVEGLTAEGLRSGRTLVPATIVASLADDSTRIARDGLASAVECNRLTTAFAAASVPLLFIKGLTLARLAYPNPFVKMGWDIDLLVDPADVGRAASVLDRLGYRAQTPADADAVVRWHRTNKESVWRCGVHFVELHSRLTDNHRTIPKITVHSQRQSVEVAPGMILPTLARDELFAYLTVHGGSSNWFRLKWACDLAAVVRDCDPQQLACLVAHARTLGAGRAPAQAILLCAALFGGVFAEAAARLGLASNPVNRWLAASAMTELVGKQAHHEPTERRLGTLRMHLTHLWLGSGWTYPAHEVARKVAEQFRRS
ncbi:nucleotidyltransferase family protein [Sphingomonas sp.]|uniref:nucleotidyltransferase domain-containing protein n=1 Tax=Sphingomonas sp. TaxID=28214 RepID=UPI00286AEEE0|nr:nucleotidyltransferase family protein [Sphingomonas sp.]